MTRSQHRKNPHEHIAQGSDVFRHDMAEEDVIVLDTEGEEERGDGLGKTRSIFFVIRLAFMEHLLFFSCFHPSQYTLCTTILP